MTGAVLPSGVRWEDTIRALADRGWGHADFDRNQMAYAAELVLGLPGSGRERWETYWRTVSRLSQTLNAAGITGVFLKSRRHYPYHDTNVDILIAREDWERTIQVLDAGAWQIPSAAVRFKQNMVERSKLKLPSRDKTLVPAHLYGAVTWRYQSDVGFLPNSGHEGVWLEQIRMEDAAGGPFPGGDSEILVPTFAADLLIHAAQTVFENYRLFLGEALFFDYLMRVIPGPAQESLQRLADARGAASVLETARHLAREELSGLLAQPGSRWPVRVSWDRLWRCWWDRAVWRFQAGKTIRGAEELAGYLLFAVLYTGKRQGWDRLRGRR